MRPLECLILPGLARLQNRLEELGYPDALHEALDGYNDEEYTKVRASSCIERGELATRTNTQYLNFMMWWAMTPQGSSFWRLVTDKL